MDLRINRNTKEFSRGLNNAARKQIPFAMSVAINDVLRDVKRNWEKQLRRKLDTPTAFTMRAFRIKRATKRNLRGMVFAMSIQSDYLRWQEDGGTRQPKGRAILVPVRQRVNKYGNMPRGAVRRALASPKVFSGKPKGQNAPGVYRRAGTKKKPKLKLMISYEDRAKYTPRLALIAGAVKTTTARLPNALYRAMKRARN
ncbi:hypothetical protein J7443_17535 [Tropicibacter sp. R15_0]|uniref:hypothetical protein n=1 Tax=Tropicibacter sp. R15_0 TaxID=2821101 RepID=UPI001AD99890|nr:hypothetical protein [Tropicibacter sp. R15_0]MBO9467050.1 hypothetical protein [Tropicibacter sp. R15_0]